MNLKTIRFIFLLNFVFISSVALFAQTKPDALKLYRNGRSLDVIGRREDAKKAYSQAIEICKNELKENPQNMDSYAVYTWSLFRLRLYKDAERECYKALKIRKDARIIETLGETLFYLGNMNGSLRYMQAYINMSPHGERISVAHFFVGEIYRLLEKYNKADIAYSAAVHLDPGNALWWYRLGIAREAAGQKKSAVKAFNTALRLNPNYKAAAQALKRIKI